MKGLAFCGWRTAATALLLATLVVAAASACPTCKDGLAHADPQAANLVRGYFWSIVFMMSMPFLILLGVGGYFYWTVRRARAAQLRPAAGGLLTAGLEAAAS